MKKNIINLFASLFCTIVLLGLIFIMGFITPLSYMILGLYTFIEGKIILTLIFFGTWYIMFKAPFSTDEFIRKNNNK